MFDELLCFVLKSTVLNFSVLMFVRLLWVFDLHRFEPTCDESVMGCCLISFLPLVCVFK